MSTRIAIIVLSCAIIVALLLVTRFGTSIPFMKEKSDPDPMARPSSKPDRPDLEFLNQFYGQPMEEILGVLKETISDVVEEQSAATALVSSLPNEPYPFPEGAKPANEIALKQYIERVENGKLGEPSMVDLWRYNLASAALGKKADSLPEELRIRVVPDVKTENFPIQLADRSTSELIGPIAVGNFNKSNTLEIVSHGGSQLWAIDEEGKLTELDGLDGINPGWQIKPADYDQDGDLDLFITRRSGLPNSLLQNNGKGKFTDVTIEAGLLSFSDTLTAEWTDYDLDGLIDLLIGSQDHPFEVFRQTSAGKFEPFSWELELWIPYPVEHIKVADFNNDGYPDFFLSINGTANQLLFAIPSSKPKNWGYLDSTKESELPFADDSVVVDTIDFDNDGDLDLLIGKASETSEKRVSSALNNIDGELKLENHLKLLQNDGEGVLLDVTDGSGLGEIEDIRRIHVMDLDNDGFEDILAITGDMAYNYAFWNRGGVRFRDVSIGSRLNYLNSPEEICSTDVDGDGALDLFLADNEGGVKWVEAEGLLNGWLELNLFNAKPGTKITILTRDTDWILQPIHRIVDLNPKITIGLGQVDKIEQIEIYPPQAIKPVETLKKIKPNQSLTIKISEKNGDQTASVNPPSE